MSTDINKLPHLDTAVSPGEYQWCGVRVEIDTQLYVYAYNEDELGIYLGRGRGRGLTLADSVQHGKGSLIVRWPAVRDRLIREHAWLLDLMRSVYDCRPDSDTIMDRMREETQ